jgi:hypothetical protein
MQDFDYTGLFTTMMMKERDFVLLEWDIAIERNGLDKFLKKIERKREVIHAVPYQVLSGDQLVWVPTNEDWSWVNYGVKTSAHFGFGCTYFPLSRIRHWKPNPIDPRLTDTNFSNWHFNHFGPVQLHWDIKVVHLNV